MEELTYEKAMKEFEEIVAKLSGEDVLFEDALKLFERGQELSVFLSKKLNDFSGKVFEIKKDLSGNIKEEEIDDED